MSLGEYPGNLLRLTNLNSNPKFNLHSYANANANPDPNPATYTSLLMSLRKAPASPVGSFSFSSRSRFFSL